MNVQTDLKEQSELAVIKPLTAAMVFVPGGVDAILEKIAAEIRSFKPDISTQDGRAQIASIAYKVARSKTALDEMGKDLVAEWKSKAAAVDAERRTIREKLDALKEEVRKPLTDWENADKARIEAHEQAIRDIEALLLFDFDPTAATLQERIDTLAQRPPRQWDEFCQRASAAISHVGKRLEDMHDVAVKREAERAELERLRAEQVAREQKERDDRIAAAAAEKARFEAEAVAKRAADEAAARAEAERQRIEKEKADAIARAERAEADKKAAAAKAEEDARQAAAAAERNHQAAIENERKRVADAQAAADVETARREADKKHRAKINNEALVAILKAAGISSEQGTNIVIAIAKGEVPHVKISY
jgi:septal ring factor EnvC (AmiA/AmiB activator)